MIRYVKNLIGDALYIDSKSIKGTIAKIRQYAEVVIRKSLNLPDNKQFTLGDKNIIH